MIWLLACLPQLSTAPDSASGCSGVEVCNDLDDDCDGAVDESPSDGLAWSLDEDGDGFGSAEGAVVACTAPPDRVPDASDCDDTEPDRHPGADEWCDDIDQDCDGVVDEGGLNATAWYEDADQDGYGVGEPVYACDAPDDRTDLLGDCDDAEPEVHPEADELCNDRDDDCDGAIDDSAVDAPTWYVDDDGDGYGNGDMPFSACEQPDAASESGDDCDDDAFGTNPGAADACNGLDDDCSGVVDDGGLCPCDMEWGTDGTPYMFCGDYELKWTAARSACSYYGYHLVTLDDATEDAWVDSALTSYNLAGWWTGLNDRDDEGVWVWEDGSSSTYTNWADDEPNNYWGEDCMELWHDKNDAWNDNDCDDTQHFICEL